MKVSYIGVNLIKSFEQCRLVAYLDGGGVWTIGWGHTGPEVIEGLTCTQLQADVWLEEDIAEAAAGVAKGLDVAVTQNQFDALVCFAFNVGVEAEEHSTLLRLVNQSRMQEAADQFPKWCHDNGQVVNGLVRRRAAERALFLTDMLPG